LVEIQVLIDLYISVYIKRSLFQRYMPPGYDRSQRLC